MPIVHRRATVEEIRTMLRQSPLGPVRQMLPDQAILDACQACGYTFRRRLYDPVVTVLHYLTQALQREESFAATWQGLWTPLTADLPELAQAAPSLSALTHARGRLPKEVLQRLAERALHDTGDLAQRWRGLRLLALDGTTLSMPRTAALFQHFGRHRARGTAVRYPLARFCSLLAVGSSTLLDYRCGPFTTSETALATPLLGRLGAGDLVLADRCFAGSPTLARLAAQGAQFLMRKNARLMVQRLPVVQRLGTNDFLVDLPMSRPARRQDPTLPETVRLRIFRATWRTPTGQQLCEWFVTSLTDPRRFKKRTLAKLYHERWRIETSYLEFKHIFHGDVLRSKTVAGVQKELAAHVLAYQLVRRLMVAAAHKHRRPPTHLSLLNAARAIVHYSQHMAAAPAWALPIHYQRLLDTIAANRIDLRPGRLEPRAVSREPKHYPKLRRSRAAWRRQRLRRTG